MRTISIICGQRRPSWDMLNLDRKGDSGGEGMKGDRSGLRFGIVVSRFNEFITGKLLSGAQDALNRHGAWKTRWRSRGFRELLKFLPWPTDGRVRRYDAVIALGA